MGWKGFKDPALVEKAVSHGFHAIVTKDRDKNLEKANASLGNPLCIIEVSVPTDARGPQAEEAVKQQMPDVLKRLDAHQRLLAMNPEWKARERKRGLEEIRETVERVAE